MVKGRKGGTRIIQEGIKILAELRSKLLPRPGFSTAQVISEADGVSANKQVCYTLHVFFDCVKRREGKTRLES